jgi:hypothetical protein
VLASAPSSSIGGGGSNVNFIANSNLTPLGKRPGASSSSSGGGGGDEKPTASVTASVAAAIAGPSGGLPPSDNKSPVQLINEMLARLGQGPAAFELVTAGGQPNAPFFLMQVRLMDQTYTGEGRAKKLAKTRAAEKALLDTEAWYWPGIRRRQREEEQSGGDGGDGGEKVVEGSSGVGVGEGDGGGSSVGRQPGSYPK